MKFDFTKEQKEFNKKYKLDDRHYWECHGKPVLLHSTCERVAVMEGINNLDMEIVEINSEKRLCVIKCTGKLGSRSEVSYGEASPKNTISAYFVAMAEKRSKDRVILKLVNMSGLVYSESDVVKDKDGKWHFADEVDVFEMTTNEELAKATAELDKMEKEGDDG